MNMEILQTSAEHSLSRLLRFDISVRVLPYFSQAWVDWGRAGSVIDIL